MSFPLDTELDLLRSVHSLTSGTDFLRTSAGGGGGGGAVTPTGFATPVGAPGQVSVTNVTTQLFAANSSRAYAHIMNNSSQTIYIQFFSSAAIGQGIRLSTGAFFTISGFDLWLGAVNAISPSTALIDTFEAGY